MSNSGSERHFFRAKSGEWYEVQAMPEFMFNNWQHSLSWGTFFNVFVKPLCTVTKLTDEERQAVSLP